MYIYEQKEWPEFIWDCGGLSRLLALARHRQGRLLGRMEGLGFELRDEATVEILTQDAVKSSEIEGLKVNPESVRSSLARKLGLEQGGTTPADRYADGMVEVLLDATRNHDQPLSEDRLVGWHAALFPTGRSGLTQITVGVWRKDEKGPMQVVSGPMGKETVHFQAPASEWLDREMSRFISWFNEPSDMDPVIRSALAHLRFVTIHPFDDGNGRIARAIADMALAQGERSPHRFYSMSSQIQRERKAYYAVLENTQKGSLDVTAWLEWYLNCLLHAVDASDEMLESVLARARFWDKHAGKAFNDRQRELINRLLSGFEGKLTSSKWAKIGKCSQDTALRDITDLLDRGVLIKEGAGGRSTSYRLGPTR